MILAFLSLIALAAIIYVSCEFFVNAVEWLGRRLNLGATAVGAVLAAFGTALPESAVTFVAVVFGKSADAKDVGVGAALGGPLVLATIAYAVVGIVLLARRKAARPQSGTMDAADLSRLRHDQAWFFWIFLAKVALGVLVFSIKPWLSIGFVICYAVYIWRHLRSDSGHVEEDDLEPLRFRPRDPAPALGWSIAQTVAALAVIGFAAHLFVIQLESVGRYLHVAPHIIALLLSPIATELPETMNAIIWVRQGKERMAFFNISGAMMIQATIPSALGIAFTPWQLDAPLLISAAATASAIVWLWIVLRRGRVDARLLLLSALGYAAFAAALPFVL